MTTGKAVVQNKYGHFLVENQDVWVKEYPDAGLFTWGLACRLAANFGGTATKNYGTDDATYFTPAESIGRIL